MVLNRLMAWVSLGVAGCLFAASALAANNRPDGYNLLCQQGETCSLAAPALVAFGSRELFVYKVLSGNFSCSAATFGRNPAADTAIDSPAKSCSIPAAKQHKIKATAGSSSSSSSSGLPLVNKALNNGRYVIISRFSGKALEITGQAPNESSQLVQNPYVGNPSQLWDVTLLGNGYYSVKSALNGKSLGIADWSANEGAKVSPIPWLDTLNQHWTISSLGGGSFSIVSRFSGKSLDVVELNTRDQAPVRLWTYWGGDNQQWQFASPKPTASKH